MKAQITFKTQTVSKQTGQTAYMLGLKCEDGTNRKAWVDEGYRNFTRWEGKMLVGMVLDNLNISKKDKGVVDADSYPVVIEMPRVTHTEPAGSVLKPEKPETPETSQLFDIEPIQRSQQMGA